MSKDMVAEAVMEQLFIPMFLILHATLFGDSRSMGGRFQGIIGGVDADLGYDEEHASLRAVLHDDGVVVDIRQLD